MSVVCMGEAILDHYPDLKNTFPGGVAANYAMNLAQQGAKVSLITRIGDDKNGRLFVEKLANHGVDTQLIQWDSLHPTAVVDVKIGPDGTPKFQNKQTTRAFHFIEYTEKAVATLAAADAVVTTAFCQMQPQTRATVIRLLKSVNGRRIFFDFNAFTENPVTAEILQRMLVHASGLKINNHELNLAARLLGITELPFAEQITWIYQTYHLEFMVVSLGGQGAMFLRGKEKQVTTAATAPITDTNGCGDAMGSTALMGWLRQADLHEIVRSANAAALSVGQHYGALPNI